MAGDEGRTYWDYLELDKLLTLQGGLERDETKLVSDELHFIIVHQTFELWFKLILRELRLARDHLAESAVPEDQIPYVVHHLRRVATILEHAVNQFKVMETLTPQDFLGFREKLVPASGFQSFQMRELEILLGLKEEGRHSCGGTDPLAHIRDLARDSPAGNLARERIDAARQEGSLHSALNDWLYRTPIQGSRPSDSDDETQVLRFLESYFASIKGLNEKKQQRLLEALGKLGGDIPNKFTRGEEQAHEFLFATDQPEESRHRVRRIRAAALFIESYRELPLLAWPRLLLDTVVETEEQMVIWRSRHARMVERIIGRRVGTGGSSGVEYLDRTAQYRVFTDLWAVRANLLPAEALPELERRDDYGFAIPRS